MTGRIVSHDFQLSSISSLLVISGFLLVNSISYAQDEKDDVALGKAIYERSCAYCHGLDGDGEGPISPYLDQRPRDFREGTYKFRSTPSGEVPTDWDLMLTLTRGIHGTSMMGWGSLEEPKRWQIISYIKTFSDRFSEEEGIESVAIGPIPEPTLESVQRGKEIFAEVQCWSCHGYGGKGDGPSAKFLEDDYGNPIIPRDLTNGNNFGRGHSPHEIYLTLITGIDGTPMPSYKDSFEDRENALWDLAHYVSFLAGGK